MSAAQKLVNLKRSARRRGLECSLDLAVVEKLLAAKTCPTCDVALDDSNRTVDRVDAYRGYIRDNVRAQCVRCNQAKGELEQKAFRVKPRS